jgi:hypothetical protein
MVRAEAGEVRVDKLTVFLSERFGQCVQHLSAQAL